VEAFQELPDVRVLIYQPSGAPAPERIVNRTKRPAMTLSRANVLRVMSRYCVLGYQLTLLEVHKLLYFLQFSGEKLQLRFTKEAYGPYADNLRHVLHRFEGHFTLGFGDGRNSPATPIKLIPNALKEAEEFAAGHETEGPETIARLDWVTQLIEGFESPYGMELLASVHWVATHPEEQATDLDSVIQAIYGWNERKRQIIKPEHIRIAWERLREKGWVQRGRHK
jgi:O-acetyl-ADP-ribose deacetylase (regulator of RNase III)